MRKRGVYLSFISVRELLSYVDITWRGVKSGVKYYIRGVACRPDINTAMRLHLHALIPSDSSCLFGRNGSGVICKANMLVHCACVHYQPASCNSNVAR